MSVLAPAAVLLPLLFPVLALVSDSGRTMRYGLPLLPLPALAVALLAGPGWTLELPYLLNGGAWLLDDLRQVFLLLTPASGQRRGSMPPVTCMGSTFVGSALSGGLPWPATLG